MDTKIRDVLPEIPTVNAEKNGQQIVEDVP